MHQVKTFVQCRSATMSLLAGTRQGVLGNCLDKGIFFMKTRVHLQSNTNLFSLTHLTTLQSVPVYLIHTRSSPFIYTANTLISSTKCNRFSHQKKARNFLSKELGVISQIQVETLLDRHLAYCDAQFCGHPDVGLRPWPQATGWADSGNIREVFSADSPSGVSRL